MTMRRILHRAICVSVRVNVLCVNVQIQLQMVKKVSSLVIEAVLI